jgi:hypothetical protein
MRGFLIVGSPFRKSRNKFKFNLQEGFNGGFTSKQIDNFFWEVILKFAKYFIQI